ncbi:MAG: sulfate permease [Gemmatimonadales bacterium]|nr:sulfate permease [Gemmatimonadales bacterium]
MSHFVPKLLTTLQGYTRPQFAADLTAGVIVGVVALPLCIAFAIASGLTPERGLYTGIVAGLLISLLGGSRVQIGGPTGAFVVIVAGIVAQYGVDGLIVATLMAGFLLVAMGLLKLGAVIKFIPFPVITGFTAGIALIIFSQQIKDLLGLSIEAVPAEFFGKWASYLAHASTVDLTTAVLGFGTLAILVLWPRVSTKVPAPFVALVAGTVVVAFFELPVDTIGSRFGVIDARLPSPHWPTVTERMLIDLAAPALTLALLGAIESLLSAVVADGMIGSRHRSNMELIAQGAANIASPLFGGMPATGAIARTATNVRNGGRTPIAGVVHALTLLVITLFAGRYAAMIPMATLAAILVMVAYHMSEWRTFRSEIRGAPRTDVAIMLATFGLTVLVDLSVAIAVGMVLAAFLFMKRMSEIATIEPMGLEQESGSDELREETKQAQRQRVPRDVKVYDINGPFFFGAAESFKDALRQVHWKPRALILDMDDVPVIDSTGLRALAEVVRQCRKEGIQVLLCNLDPRVRATVAASHLSQLFEPGELSLSFDEALMALGGTGEHPSSVTPN